MNKHSIVVAVTALSMGLTGTAFAQSDKDVRSERAAQGHTGLVLPRDGRDERAQGQDRGPDRGRPSDSRGDDHGRPGDYRGADRGRPADYRGDDRGRSGDYRGPDRGPGAGPDHNFYRGGRLPAEYRDRQYVVDDWRGHRLSAPPRGYHWVQTGGDYVLVAIATGVIASILLNQ